MFGLDPSLVEVIVEVVFVERTVGFAPLVLIEGVRGSLRERTPIDHPEVTARAGLELQLVIRGEVGHVFDLEAVAIAHLGVGGLLVGAMTRSGGTEDAGVGVGRY